MFIGRQKELESLQTLYNKPGFKMSIIYGRRRIGKSTLIAKFVQDKKNIYYTATKVGSLRNLELLSRQVTNCLDPDLNQVVFPSIEDLFDFISRKSDQKLVFVIDELPYWAEKDESLLSILQKYIDTDWANKDILLILCGSALSFMESKVLSEKSPLFGRRDSQIKLEAFNYLEAAEFVPLYSPEEKAICYGVTGGIAKYLALFDPEKTLDENIRSQFFQTSGYLYDETRNLLVQEFSDTTLVNNIIEQIASGETTLNGISQKIHEGSNTVLYVLGKLINVGLVEKIHCITEEKNHKKTQYVLKDHMFKFWYQFIPKATSVIELGQGTLYYDRIVKPQLHSYMGKVFEDMCRYYTLIRGVTGTFGCFLTQVGTWWGTENMENSIGQRYAQSADIDIVGVSPIDHSLVLGECKFKNSSVDKDIFETLLRRGRAIPSNYKIVHYLFFSLGGFSEWVYTAVKDDLNYSLVTLDDMYLVDKPA